MKEIRVRLNPKDADILHLKIKNQELVFEGPGATEGLAT